MRTAHIAASVLLTLVHLASLAVAQTMRLNGTLPQSLAGGSPRDFAVSADGTRVVFSGDFETIGRVELWSAPADHSAPPAKLSGSLLTGGGVTSFVLVGTRAVYHASLDGRNELFSVPIDGSAGPIRLDPLRRVVEFAPTPDGTRIVYRTLSELFSVPIDGSAAPVELMNSPETCVAFYVAPAGGRVVARWNGAVDEYRAQSVLGTGPVLVIDTPIQENNALELVRFSNDGTRFFHEGTFAIPYQAYRTLRSAPVDGSTPGIALASFDFEWSSNWAVTSDGASVVLGIADVFRVPSTGGPLVTLANPPGWVDWIALTPDQSTVLFSHDIELQSVALAHVPLDGSQPYADIPLPVAGTLYQLGTPLFTASGAHMLFSDWKGIYSLSTSWSSPPVPLASVQQVSTSEEPPQLRLLPGETDVAFAASVIQDCNTGWPRKELYRRPIDGSGPLVRLDRLTGEGVTHFALAEGGARAVYLHASNPDTASPLALFGVPVDGSSRPRFYHEPQGAPPTLGDVTDSWISPDGSVAIYRADQEYNERFGLYAVSLSEPGKPVRLCEQFATTTVRFSADSSRVAFVTQIGSFFYLYCALTDGSEPAVLIKQVAGSSDPFSFDPALSSDGEYVTFDLWHLQLESARTDGSTPPVAAGPADMFVADIGLDDSTQRVFFTGTVNGVRRMYSMPVDGSQPAIRIVPQSGTTPPLTGAIASGGKVYYLRTTAGVDELYAVPIDGSAPPERISSPLVVGGSVASFLVQNGVVLYRADGTVDERIDLYRSTGPSTSVTLATPAGVFDVASFVVSADGSTVAFGQEDGDAPLVDLWTVPAAGGTATEFDSRVRAFALTPELELVCSVEPSSAPFEVVAHKLGGRRKVLATLLDTVPVTALVTLPGERVVWRGDAREAGVSELFLSLTGPHGRSPQRPNVPPGDGGTIVR